MLLYDIKYVLLANNSFAALLSHMIATPSPPEFPLAITAVLCGFIVYPNMLLCVSTAMSV
jgi:hypothetical protein